MLENIIHKYLSQCAQGQIQILPSQLGLPDSGTSGLLLGITSFLGTATLLALRNIQVARQDSEERPSVQQVLKWDPSFQNLINHASWREVGAAEENQQVGLP